MPGCYAEAEKIALGTPEIIENELHAERISDDEPTGCSRKVYRIGDVVYKLGTADYAMEDNGREFRMFEFCKDRPWASPVSLYCIGDTDVLCMPYYENRPTPNGGSFHCNDDDDALYEIEREWREWAEIESPDTFPSCDFHTGNYRYDEKGQIKIIDGAGVSWY